MTRREWLKSNPPPATNGELLDRAGKLELEVAHQVQQLRAQAASNPAYQAQCNAQIASLMGPANELKRQAAAAPGKCPLHPQAGLFRHMNRIEDLFVCQQGPHFLLWTMLGGRAQFSPLADLTNVPALDGPMG